MNEQENYLHRDLQIKQERMAGVFRDQFRNFSQAIEKVLRALPPMQKEISEVNRETKRTNKEISEMKRTLASMQREIKGLKTRR